MKWKPLIITGLFAVSILTISTTAKSQTRLPDGSVLNKDGSRRMPNGTIKYPNRDRNSRADDILYPRRNNTTGRRYPRDNNNRQWLPPGQAKKRYGGEAKDYAPGHNKGQGKWNKREDDDHEDRNNRNDDDRDDRNKKGHGKHDKGKDKDD